MSAPPRDPSDPREWLRRARSNLARAAAGRPTSEVLWEDLAFDAQQAAEKAIKAVLIAWGISPPRTHSFGPLISRVEETGVVVPIGLRDVTNLTKYAVRYRYPAMESMTEEQYRGALAVASPSSVGPKG